MTELRIPARFPFQTGFSTTQTRVSAESRIDKADLCGCTPAYQNPNSAYIAKMDKVVTKMKEAGLSEAAIGAFKQNYEQLVAGVTGLVRPWLVLSTATDC